jgi:hypothetical protein
MTSSTRPTRLHDFITTLDDGDFDAAANCFSADAFFIRPVRNPETGAITTEVIRGRAAIRAYFARRGTQPYRHQITNYIPGPETCFVEGVVVEMNSLFMSYAQVSNGEITRCTQVATPVTPEAVRSIRGGSSEL